MVDAYQNFSTNIQTFENYYYTHQDLYFKEQEERYQVYITETSFYCISSAKEREVLWRGEVEVIDADKVNRNINKYSHILLKGLRDNKLLVSLQ